MFIKARLHNVDLTVENVEGGIRQVILIKDASQPSRYEFPMQLDQGQRFENNSDGSVNIIDKQGKRVLTILKPWAKDANGKDLKTRYEVIDKVLVQHIDFENAVFPITADPTWCGDFVTGVSWVKRRFYGREAWSLRLKPTWCLNYHPYTPWSAWEELWRKTPYHKTWTREEQKYGTNKYWSMYNQFACHRDWVKWNNLLNMLKSVSNLTGLSSYEIGEYQNYYHLEPERPDRGYWGTKDASCNQRNDLVGKII